MSAGGADRPRESPLTSSHMRDESFERRREEILNEPEFDGALRVSKYRYDHEERHAFVK